jgi:hypothetical protein
MQYPRTVLTRQPCAYSWGNPGRSAYKRFTSPCASAAVEDAISAALSSAGALENAVTAPAAPTARPEYAACTARPEYAAACTARPEYAACTARPE